MIQMLVLFNYIKYSKNEVDYKINNNGAAICGRYALCPNDRAPSQG